jgi:hypothetical protein
MHVYPGLRGVHWKCMTLINIGKPNINRLVDKKQGGVPGPSPGIVHSAIVVLIDQAGTDLLEQTQHA